MSVTVKRIQLAIDLQLVVMDEGDGTVDLRLYRRSPAEVGMDAFLPTAAGFKLPQDRIPDLTAALDHLHSQAGSPAGGGS